MPLTKQQIDDLKMVASIQEGEGKRFFELAVDFDGIRELADAAGWALENGYRPVSQARIPFEELVKMEIE